MAPIEIKDITKISLVSITPWSILISWQAPDGIDKNMIDFYSITGSIVIKHISNETYNIIPIMRDVQPSSEYLVNIQAVYRTGQKSGLTTAKTTTPKARKLYV